MKSPLISVLMPAYNVENYVIKAIESILKQTYSNLELLIADDQSTDSTASLIRSLDDSRIRIYTNKEKLGYTKTCNQLFPLCKGDYITFQDADDLSSTDRLLKQLTYLQAHPKIQMCGTGVYIMTDNEKILDIVHRNSGYHGILAGLTHHNQFIGSTIMCSKLVYNEIGGYRPEFSRWGNQDYDWAYRICEKFKAVNLPEPLYYYRQNIHSNSKKISELRAIGPQIVQALGKLRAETGSDYLFDGNIGAIAELEKKLLVPYKQDKSLIYFKHAQNRIYIHQYKEARNLIMESIKIRPFNIQNYILVVSLVARWAYRSLKNEK